MKKILFVLALTAIVLAGCGPTQPKGNLVFLDLYDNYNMQFLPIAGGQAGTPIVTGVIVPELTTYAAPDGNQLVTWKFDENGPGATIYVYTAGNLASPVVLESPKELDPLGSSQDMSFFWKGGSLYLLANHYDIYRALNTFTVYRLAGDAFTKVRSFSAGSGYYYVNLGRGGSTPDFGKMLITDGRDIFLANTFIYDTVTGDITEVLGDPWEIGFSEISPDGNYLLYYSHDTECLISYRVADGQEQKVVCPEGNIGFSGKSMTWSANGKNMTWTLEFSRELTRIYVFDISDPDNPVAKQSFDVPVIHYVTWSPDSRYLAFFADPGNDPGFYVMDVATGKTEKVYSQPNWKSVYTQDGGLFPFWVLGWIK